MDEAPDGQGNFASLILRHRKGQPDRKAITIPKTWNDESVLTREDMTYGELSERVQMLRAGFAAEGIKAGDRVVVLFPVCIDLYAVIIALFASGITAVLIDTGMGARRIKQSLETANAKGVVSMNAFLKYRFALWALWKIPNKYSVDKPGLFVKPFSRLLRDPTDVPPIARTDHDEALITFTSGSTGRPKGANRTHGHLARQYRALLAEYPPQPDQVDMPCFPVVALHDLCCGITVAMPPVDFGNPGSVTPAPIARYALTERVTSMTGAPSYMSRLADHLLENDAPNHNIRTLGVGGAPVSKDLCQRIEKAFPASESFVVYGSTEAEPIAHAHIQDARAHTGDGYVVGTVAKAAKVALLNVPEPMPTLDERGVTPYEVPQGAIGEVVVGGPHVNRGYIDNPEANRECKLFELDGAVWHRTGDLGYWTDAGLLCLVGRLKDVVVRPEGILQPYPLEAKIEELADVTRAAVLSTPRHPTGAVILTTDTDTDAGAVVTAVRNLSAMQSLTELPIYFVTTMPVDGRHNSKVDRPRLREMVDNKTAMLYES